MPKRRRSPAGKESAAAKPASRWTRADIKHTSVYLPEAAYEALRQVAFDERRPAAAPHKRPSGKSVLRMFDVRAHPAASGLRCGTFFASRR